MEQKIEKKTVLDILSLINYAEGGIVSKEFEHSSAGNITLFAFDKGQKLSEHTAPYDALLQILDGKAEIVIDMQTFQLNDGQMIIIPQGAPHAINATEQFKMILTMIKK
ncbi:MAG: cupin domain-containing protein [Prevotella sp.]|nr:cupin domain-containing protein [Prevotella sp.]